MVENLQDYSIISQIACSLVLVATTSLALACLDCYLHVQERAQQYVTETFQK